MSLKALRRDKGWSQEQLSEISGVSVRTIQRIEKGEVPGLETLKALAAAFEQTVAEFQQALDPAAAIPVPADKSVLKYGWKGLFINLGTMMGVITWLMFLEHQFGISKEVIYLLAMMWGIGLMVHAIHLLNMDE